MRLAATCALILSAVVLPDSFGQSVAGLDRAESVGKFLNGTLPSRTPRPSTGSWRLVNAFPGLTFIDPVQMLPVPFSNRLMVLEKSGRLVVFENNENATSKTVLIDIRSQVESSHDSGMVGLAFHPEFGVPASSNRHFLYVYYRYTPLKSDTDRAYCRLSRFTWNPSTNSIAPASEFVLINQYDRHNWHNGGGIFFGLDGFLHVSVGDEGGSNDQYNTGQRMDTGLLAGVLRIDVDQDPTRSHPVRRQPRNPSTPPGGWPNSYSQGYYIPNDNPWQSPSGALLEEFYAIGLRSPHRMTQDPVTGDIWVGDVGQGTQEEVSKVVRGGNLQWPYREGSVAGPKTKPASLIGVDVTPVHSYGRGTGSCVIGGYVYRGALHPELSGKYLFGDHGSGTIWSLDTSTGGAVVTSLLTLASHGPGPKNGMGAFGIDASGEVYVLSLAGTDLDGGRVYRLEKSTEGVPEPPRLLSQTTAFSDLANLTPSRGVMPYGVNQPLWSDGSNKQRWIAIPNDGTPSSADEKIVWSEEGNWNFPIGTVLIKHFEFPGRRLETRFFALGDDSTWYGFTYRWREDGSDAELLPGGPIDETFTVNGTTRTWHFPGRNECTTCHTAAAGRVLGVKTRQLNGDFFYAATGRSANQVVTLNRLGFFSPAIDESTLPGLLTSRRQDDASASLERRARSYLDVNCSHCHQPAAPTQASFDARLETPPFFQNLINVTPNNPLGIAGARLVNPARPDLSVVHRRVGSTATGVAMPPIAKNLADDGGLQLLTDWINSLDPAIVPSGPVGGTPPRDHSAPILTLSKSGTGPEVTGPFTVNLTASETIRGLTAGDFSVVNGSVSAVAGSGTNWTFTVTPNASGPGTISIASDRVTDINGNANHPLPASLAFTYQPPTNPSNLLTNGDFENGLDGWDQGGNVSTTTSAYRGLRAASVGTSTYLVRTLPVTELQNYVYSGRVFASAPGVRVEAGLSFWDSNGVWIDDRIVTLQPGAAWELFERAFTAPVGARSVAVWILTNASGGVSVDDLALTAGGTGEPRPAFGPAFTNLLENGGFESGLSPWDRGGLVELSTSARSGTAAARLPTDSFIVQTRIVTPGEKLALFGAVASPGPNGRLEAGFSFWDASGNWITDRTLILPENAAYETFLVDTPVPEGSATMTLWVWRPTGGNVTVDDLALFRPDEENVDNLNLLSNGGFEDGSLLPWDTGGTDVLLVSPANTGANAAQLGSESFVVQSRSGNEGEQYRLTGSYRTPGSTTAPREAGLSYWSSTGAWLGDALATLTPSTNYQSFEILGTVPTGAASFSAWIWSGANSSLVVDDLRLERIALATLTPEVAQSPMESLQETSLAGDMTKISLKSGRSLDLSGDNPIALDPELSLALGSSQPFYANGWIPSFGSKSGDSARAFGSPAGDRQSLITAVAGPGIVSARWMLDGVPGASTLILVIDGLERARWISRGGESDWRTVSVQLTTPGLHSIEFRLDPGNGSSSGIALAEAQVRNFCFHRGFPILQPDLAIANESGSFVGAGIYRSDAAMQSASATTRGRKPAIFEIQTRNDAPQLEDGLRLSGPSGNRFARATYYSIREGRLNITTKMILGLYETDPTAPGGGESIEMEVRKSGRSRKKGFIGIVHGHSLLDPSETDGVRVRTTPR